MKNQAYGKWTKEETNWSAKDNEYVQSLLKETPKAKTTSLKELEEIHESLHL